MLTYLRDTWTIFQRSMILSLRNPAWVIIGLMQPILYLALFGPLLLKLTSIPGFPAGDAWRVLVPGLLVQLGIFGGAFVGFAIISEWREGVIDRMMVTPAARSTLILGRVLRDVVVLVVQALILILAAMLFGLRVPFQAVVLAVALVGMLGASFSALSYAMGLILKSEDAFAPLINTLALPIMLLSAILLPMTLAPIWLQRVSDISPFKHMVDGLRAIFRGELWSFSAALGFGLSLALLLISLWWGTQVFRNQSK